MKRDMDLIRDLLLSLEAGDEGVGSLLDVESKGYTKEQIGYHSWLLVDAGLALGVDATHLGSVFREVHLTSLTWSGHEFLDAARDDTRWQQAKMMMNKAGAFALPALMKVLIDLAVKGALGS